MKINYNYIYVFAGFIYLFGILFFGLPIEKGVLIPILNISTGVCLIVKPLFDKANYNNILIKLLILSMLLMGAINAVMFVVTDILMQVRYDFIGFILRAFILVLMGRMILDFANVNKRSQ
jgi:hypothetical protein